MLVFVLDEQTGMICCIDEQRNSKSQFSGAPNVNFRKISFGRRFEIQNFRNICCKVSSLPASPRILEHLKNGISAHF